MLKIQRGLDAYAIRWSCRVGSPSLPQYTARRAVQYVSMADELLRYRSQFPILERTTYLISNSLGAMPGACMTP